MRCVFRWGRAPQKRIDALQSHIHGYSLNHYQRIYSHARANPLRHAFRSHLQNPQNREPILPKPKPNNI